MATKKRKAAGAAKKTGQRKPKPVQNIPQPADHTILSFGKHRIRAKSIDGATWFAADDIVCAANYARLDEMIRRHPTHRRTCSLSCEAGWEEVELITSLAAQTVATIRAEVILYLWIRKHDAIIQAGGDTDQRPPIEMLLDGQLPPKPKSYSSQYQEWHALRDQHRARRQIHFDAGPTGIGTSTSSTKYQDIQ